ncbi:MAG TPA: sigma 54-interacting transcriptional regulator [Steroidobacteraceae bacterium]|nr:sigma 54-interacting transcriptional regulator [Steroidobacteraceae bacterium]
MEARLLYCDSESSRIDPESRAKLARAGIEAAAANCAAACPTLLFFCESGPALLQKIAALRAAGTERVLALGVGAPPDQSFAWQLLCAGASDLLTWNDTDEVAMAVAARLTRWREIDELVDSPLIAGSLVGKSPRWQSTLRQVVEVARFTAASALILGESGTGKELIARLFHSLDPRQDKGNLVIVDCTTIVPELSGSEFFGHERGAFTGACGTRDGAFALARGGTVFLDEVGELPLALQAQLLRAVQEQTFKRVGGNTWFKTDFRLVCATNRDLQAAVHRGEFRHDLYHRIANWVFTLPPLRERTEDIVPLARHFVQQRRAGRKPLELDATVEQCLLRRHYPGNIRELRQLVMRIMDRHVGDSSITVGDLPLVERPDDAPGNEWRDDSFLRSIGLALSSGVGMKEIGRAAEDSAIQLALREAGGNLQGAASRLGVTDRALQLRRATARQAQRPDTQPQQVPEIS